MTIWLCFKRCVIPFHWKT